MMLKGPDLSFDLTQGDLFKDLEARGLVKQLTDPALPEILRKEKLTLYCGFDPTADCLHLGHLLPLLILRRFQLAGHRPIAVVGGATGMIGDPSGKSQERSLLDDEQLEANVRGIHGILCRFLDFEGPAAAQVVNNAEWFKGLSFVAFLRDVGKHFTVNHMIAKESVRARLEDREHGISYTEFSYMLLQAYDFYHLRKSANCRLQIGGSDQWGNITAGIDLIRKTQAAHGEEAEPDAMGLTFPLVMKADGTKFGKSEKGALWLDANRTSPYQFYQFLIQTGDADVITLLKYFTFLSIEEIEKLEESLQKEPEQRAAQAALARELTTLVHGETELKRAQRASEALFGASIRELDERLLLDVMAGAPATTKGKEALSSGFPLLEALVETGLSPSKGAARKEISGGGIYVNNERATDPAANLSASDLIAGSYVVLRKGKKTYHLLAFK